MAPYCKAWMNSIVSALVMPVAAVMVIGTTTAHASEIKVIASIAVKEIFLNLIPVFKKSSGHKVTTIWDGTEAITKRISGGEVVDVVLIAVPSIEKLISEGRLVAGSRADVAKSGIGVAVRAGLPKPDISSGEAVKKAVLAAKSVAHYLGPLPADIQHITVFSAGLHTAATASAAAKALVKFLTGPEAAPIIRKSGMEPG